MTDMENIGVREGIHLLEVHAFLPPLMDLGLPMLLVSLPSSEMSISVDERKHERYLLFFLPNVKGRAE